MFDEPVLTEQQYIDAVANFIGDRENTTGVYDAHFDGNDSIAIGFGLDLLVNDNATINTYLRNAGLPELTLAQQNDLNNLRANRKNLTDAQFQQAAQNLNLHFTRDQASDLLYETLSSYRTDLANRLAQPPFNITNAELPLSNMRAALLSLTYNGGTRMIGNNLRKALRDGINDPGNAHIYRAAAWVEIRYFSNADRNNPAIANGIQNRRYAESDLFGLLDGNLSTAELQQVLTYLDERRADIDSIDSTGLGYNEDLNVFTSQLTATKS